MINNCFDEDRKVIEAFKLMWSSYPEPAIDQSG